MKSLITPPEYTYRVFSEKIKIDFKVPFLNQHIPDKKSLNITKATKIRNCKKTIFKFKGTDKIYTSKLFKY